MPSSRGAPGWSTVLHKQAATTVHKHVKIPGTGTNPLDWEIEFASMNEWAKQHDESGQSSTIGNP